jgi:hypothetical protein
MMIFQIEHSDIEEIFDVWYGAYDELIRVEDNVAELKNIMEKFRPNQAEHQKAMRELQDFTPRHIEAQREFRRADMEIARIKTHIELEKIKKNIA